MRALVVVLLVAGIAWGGYRLFFDLPASTPEAPPPAEEEATLGGLPLSQFYLEHDRFLPATDPEVVTAEEVSFLEEYDEVFGVVVEGHARAYPITMISYNHVVNDVIEGIPIAVTY